MTQEKRIAIAQHTLQILAQGYYINNEGEQIDISVLQHSAVNGTRLSTPGDLEALLANANTTSRYTTQFEVINETTLDASRRLVAAGNEKVLCLNFASAKNPGGGFLGGALAQEECIARASGLYPCLLQAPEYYATHRANRSCIYSDHMIYSPAVPILKDEEGDLLPQPVCVSIITSAAVNAGVVHQQQKSRIPEIIPAMRTRIEKLLALCRHKQYETLVLGAWGCGVFRNNPEDIAALFHEALNGKFAGYFKNIVFAVKTNKTEIIEPFQKRFQY
ncbi:MAG: TIGR02452 family protein [Chitinophagaceae bacterium]